MVNGRGSWVMSYRGPRPSTQDSRPETIDHRLSTACQQPFESRIALERRKIRIDAQPPGGEVVRHFEEPLEDIERLVVLTGYDIDPRQDVLKVRPGDLVFLWRHQSCAAFPVPDGLHLLTQVSLGEPEEEQPLGVVGGNFQYLERSGSGAVGVGSSPRFVTADPVGLREDDSPSRPVAVELGGSECKQESLLGIVQRPEEVPVVPEIGHQGGRLDVRRSAPDYRPRRIKIPCPELNQDASLEQGLRERSQHASAVQLYPRLLEAAGLTKRIPVAQCGGDGAGVHAGGLTGMSNGGIPAPNGPIQE